RWKPEATPQLSQGRQHMAPALKSGEGARETNQDGWRGGMSAKQSLPRTEELVRSAGLLANESGMKTHAA
ncbi:hypothetical protein E4U53_003960, partial [Claviceps sorghi]